MPAPLPPEGELRTWKEIASYLGISVREAQNREETDGMPVRRMQGSKRGQVWAYRSELDKWKANVTLAKSPKPMSSAASENRASSPTPITAAGKTILSLPNRRVFVAGTGTAIISAAAWFLRRPRPPRDLASLSVSGKNLIAWDGSGHPAWQHQFPTALRQNLPERRRQIVDLKGDGSKQVIVAGSFPPQDNIGPDESILFCFSTEGKLIWQYKPAFTFTFGDTAFDGPWHFTDMTIAPSGPHKTIWLALAHWQLRPSFLLAVGPDGSASVKFVSAGNIYTLCHAETPSGRYLLAGGVNNEYQSAALAVLKEDAPPSRSPQTAGTRFECVDGPRGTPDRYFLFPPTEVTIAGNKPYNRTMEIWKANQTYVVVTSELLGEEGANLEYSFPTTLEPQDVTFGDGWAAWHRRFEADGLLKHRIAECPHLKGPISIRRWDQRSGWTTLSVPHKKGAGPDGYKA